MMKIFKMMIFLPLLAACASAPEGLTMQEGESVQENNVLRSENDVVEKISIYEHLLHQCDEVLLVERGVERKDKLQGGVITSEHWKVFACGKENVYPVRVREHDDGTTDYLIRVVDPNEKQ